MTERYQPNPAKPKPWDGPVLALSDEEYASAFATLTKWLEKGACVYTKKMYDQDWNINHREHWKQIHKHYKGGIEGALAGWREWYESDSWMRPLIIRGEVDSE